MGFFKWLDKHVRESNGNAWSSYRAYVENEKAKEVAEKERLENLECCANCYWFEKHYTEPQYTCSKCGYSFNSYEVNYNNIHYKNYCGNFWRK